MTNDRQPGKHAGVRPAGRFSARDERHVDRGVVHASGVDVSDRRLLPLWAIPMAYTAASVAAALSVPRLEHAYLSGYTHGMAVGSALAFFSAVSSGMMALTAIVFAIAFVIVQFSAQAYSPRMVVFFSQRSSLFHAFGIFSATFTYSLVALMWTDRGGSGTVPLFSTIIVAVLVISSLLAFARLIESLDDLQLHNVLQVIGNRGRAVIRAMFPRLTGGVDAEILTQPKLSPVSQTLAYSGAPRVIVRFNLSSLASLAQSAKAVIVIEPGVGETLLEGMIVLRVHGAASKLSEAALMAAVHVAPARTFEQDPKYAIRLLVDIAIRALSPAVNDPTTAVQALDQIEDLLRHLGCRQLDARCARDAAGVIRVIFPVPTWQDYLALAFDEIRQFGATSVQVDRRLHAALVGLINTITADQRRAAVQQYLAHLDLSIRASQFDPQDQEAAFQEDRQGLGLSRQRII